MKKVHYGNLEIKREWTNLPINYFIFIIMLLYYYYYYFF